MRFEFATANRIIFGGGSISHAGQIAGECGRRALVVTGRDATRAKRLLTVLGDAVVEQVLFGVDGEPDLDVVRRGIALAKREGCDLVIGFGGGSALDTAKGIAALLTNEGDLLDYLEIIGGGKPLPRPSAPFIAIPTTAGTGSEVTRNAVFASPEHRLKVSLRSPFMLAKVALVDPELTWDLPPALTASTGMDALTQLIEPYVCTRANPISDDLCADGILRVATSFRTAFENGRDATARENMALASVFGGLALTNAGLGAVHGLAGVIGGMFPAPHGAVCGALLPHVMACNVAAMDRRDSKNPALDRYSDVARLLTDHAGTTATDGIEWVAQLVSHLKIPKLGSYGMKQEDIAPVVEKAKTANSMKANPIALTGEELSAVVDAAL